MEVVLSTLANLDAFIDFAKPKRVRELLVGNTRVNDFFASLDPTVRFSLGERTFVYDAVDAVPFDQLSLRLQDAFSVEAEARVAE